MGQCSARARAARHLPQGTLPSYGDTNGNPVILGEEKGLDIAEGIRPAQDRRSRMGQENDLHDVCLSAAEIAEVAVGPGGLMFYGVQNRIGNVPH